MLHTKSVLVGMFIISLSTNWQRGFWNFALLYEIQQIEFFGTQKSHFFQKNIKILHGSNLNLQKPLCQLVKQPLGYNNEKFWKDFDRQLSRKTFPKGLRRNPTWRIFWLVTMATKLKKVNFTSKVTMWSNPMIDETFFSA